MIVVTGAAGFIGSCLVQKLNEQNHHQLILVDEFSHSTKNKNLDGKRFALKIHRDIFLAWLNKNATKVDFIFHLGARTDTTEKNSQIFDELNVNYSKAIWHICSAYNIPLIYASSAATYGLGELGYEDDHNMVAKLAPLNPYGVSKNEFDKWALQQAEQPPFWIGLKFFNVYGPNEYHKGRMASVVFHAFRQIQTTGSMKLFRSHKPDIADGQQSRDFIYVKDVIDVGYFFYNAMNRAESGLYNLGTGQARTFLDLVNTTFEAMSLSPDVSFIDTPADIRDTYQYFTQATMDKLLQAGYETPFHRLEEGVKDYVQHYLMKNLYF